MLKRLFDIVVSGIGLILVSPIFLILAIWIKLDSEGPVFYRQVRVGKGNKDFRIFKFRSMRVGADKGSLITVGGRDPRITRSGYFIRQFKLDELPQLINVFVGDMSFVGPRPEVRHYVEMYNEEQLHVLDVRPGITDLASIKYRNENELLENADDPEQYYISTIMPDKLKLNLEYVANSSFWYDIKMIFMTIWSLSVLKVIRGFFHWYFGKDSLPYWCVLALDAVILVALCFFSYFCVLGSNGVVDFFWHKLGFISLCLIPFLAAYKIFHTYNNIIRYSSFIDLRNVILANICGTIVVILMRWVYFDRYGEWFPGYRVALFTFAFATVCMCSWRILVKMLYDIESIKVEAKRVMVYGVKDAGVSIAKSIRTQKDSDFVVSGFIAPKDDFLTTFMCGLPVLADDVTLMGELRRKHISAIMVSPLQSESFRNNERLINDLTESGIQIYMMPEAVKWDGKQNLNFSMLREVEIEDLLPREQIDIDIESIGQLLRNQCILVTGASGSIGSELVRQIAQFAPREMALIDQAETPMHDTRLFMAREYPGLKCQTIVTSISNVSRMEHIFSSHQPDYVFHAAAYKHVPMMEDNPAEAVQNNIYGTKIIADMSVKYGAKKFVMVSTDKAVNPTNVMGCSKRICEIYCQSLNSAIREGKVDGHTQFVTTRFGNVLGSNGSVIPIFREQIRRGGPVTVTHPEIIRYFMLIPEACKLVLQAGVYGNGGEIFVFDMGKPVKIVDLAKRMIALSNASNVKIEFTGLRDGEKLYEEVLNETEKTVPTDNPQIRIAKVREYSYDDVLADIDRLYKTSFEYDDMATVRIMKELVPEFKSRHSKFESLDA